jgi:hypothetical protein
VASTRLHHFLHPDALARLHDSKVLTCSLRYRHSGCHRASCRATPRRRCRSRRPTTRLAALCHTGAAVLTSASALFSSTSSSTRGAYGAGGSALASSIDGGAAPLGRPGQLRWGAVPLGLPRLPGAVPLAVHDVGAAPLGSCTAEDSRPSTGRAAKTE